MAAQISFMDAVRTRRSCYAINDKLPISDDRVEELVRTALEYVPSSFNSQSIRIVLLLNDDHRTFWNFVNEVLRPMVEEGQWHKTEAKLSGFRAGHGTVLFFEDPVTTSKLQTDFPLYSDHFPSWGVQSNAMHQYMLWCALEAEGCGVNLQHYNPIIDQKAKYHWRVPQEWTLIGQLVFGGYEKGAMEKIRRNPKAKMSMEKLLTVHGKR